MKKCPFKPLTLPIICMIVGIILCFTHLWLGMGILLTGFIGSIIIFIIHKRCITNQPLDIDLVNNNQEKLAELGTMAAGIVHEIKNPLNFINNFALLNKDLISELKECLKQISDDTKLQHLQQIDKNLDTILQHAKRAEHTINSILKQAATDQHEITETDINALLSEYATYAYHAMRVQYPKSNVIIHKILDPNIPTVMVNQPSLGRVFLNIINNGMYAACFKDKNKSPPEITLKTHLSNNIITISIKDNGDGISKNMQTKILQPFYTTKAPGQGTGLGLCISQEIIQEHGGQLTINSEPGKFAEFIITLVVGKND